MNQRPMNKLQAIIFDFDGTLATLTLDFELMKRKLAALAEAFSGERPATSSKPCLEWLEELAAEIKEHEGRDMALEFHCRGRLIIQATELDAAKSSCLFPFTLPLLADLKNRGIAIGIITRNSTAAVKTVFPNVEQHCDVFLAREDVNQVKPDPAHLHAALNRLNSTPKRAIMVGDHTLDMGNAAGVLSAGVASGNLSMATLTAGGADLVAPDAAKLMELLEEKGYL